ncbi:unnamed protein product [Oikopleura dioica]|uniref:Uncharacterized protein n=1 Tax=Oikopleura dioica TaxID=34765 RepID=E4YGQ7_OIKDI|nr:unnamed protein product [Oikopleura dioica]
MKGNIKGIKLSLGEEIAEHRESKSESDTERCHTLVEQLKEIICDDISGDEENEVETKCREANNTNDSNIRSPSKEDNDAVAIRDSEQRGIIKSTKKRSIDASENDHTGVKRSVFTNLQNLRQKERNRTKRDTRKTCAETVALKF